MSYHVATFLRVRENAIKTLNISTIQDTAGYNVVKTEELAGTMPIPNINGIPPFFFLGQKISPSVT
jgi:hypothetical protein